MPQKESLKAVIKRKKKSIPTEEGRLGKNYLFIIAINDYPNYNKLYNAVEDAKAIEQVPVILWKKIRPNQLNPPKSVAIPSASGSLHKIVL